MCFYSYSAFGSITTLFGAENPPFEIGVPGGYLPATTNGAVAEFTITNSNSWDVETWYIDNNRCVVTNSQGGTQGASTSGQYLYIVFKNIKLNKTADTITCLAYRKPPLVGSYTAAYTVPGFTLVMPTPTFTSGSSLNIPCYITTAQINLNDYKNGEGLSNGLEITDEFEWTLPSGWQTSSSQTGTFVAGKTINVILPSSSSSQNITVRAKAYEQYSASTSLQVTRNIGKFDITGNSNVNCRQTYQYSTQYYSGVSYSWQLPAGWSGSSSTNSISATANGPKGNIILTATACGQIAKDTLSVLNTKIIPDNAYLQGSDLLCSTGSIYIVNNLFDYSSVSWDFSDNIYRTYGSSNSAQLKATDNGPGYITPIVNTTCGSDTMNTLNIWVGAPDLNNITVYYSEDITGSYPDEFCPGDVNELLARADPLIDMKLNSIYWDMGSWNVYYYDNEGYVLFEIPLSFCQSENLYYEVSNNCDVAITSITIYEGICGGYYMILSPNPSSGETTITIESSKKDEKIDLNEEWDLEIFDQQQNLKENFQKVKGNTKKFNASTWKEGNYILKAKYKDKYVVGKLVVTKN